MKRNWLDFLRSGCTVIAPYIVMGDLLIEAFCIVVTEVHKAANAFSSC